jgi:hypothetical protein
MTCWCLLEVCTTSMCSNTDHLEWDCDFYWRCVLRQCAVTLITLNDMLMSIGGVYYINVQQHWSPWMRHWGLLEVCTTSMCSNIDHLEWHLDVYWRMCTTSMCSNTDDVEWHLDVYWTMRTTTMCRNTDHLEWYLDVYWRCVLRQCAATLITLNDILMYNGCVYYINVQQHWSPWMTSWCLLRVRTTTMCSNTDHLEWYLDVYWRCVLHQCATPLITLNDILMSIEGVYYVNVQQHWSPWMRPWCLLEVCTTSMCSNTDHLEWLLDVYWRWVLYQCAATLITLNDILMSNGGVYYINVQQHWSFWMRPWCLLEVCTTSMCSNTDHLEWHLDVYWTMRTTTMYSNTDHLECYPDVYWRFVLHQCAATLITLNDIVMSTGGCVLHQCAVTLITLHDTLVSIGGVYYVNVQQHWSPWMRPSCLLEVCTKSMCSNTVHLEWELDVYWRCVLRQSAATLVTLNDILMSIGGVYYINVQQHWSP